MSWFLWNFIAAIAALAVMALELHRGRLKVSMLLRLQPTILLVSLAGAHWYYLIAAWHRPYHGWRDFFDLTNGTSIQGGILFGAATMAALLKLRQEPLGPYFDALSPGLAVAQAFTRVGCFFAGCCWGRPTHVPWAVTFTDPYTAAPKGVPLHPAQLYEVVLDLGLAWFLDRRLRRAEAPAGRVWWMFIAGSAGIRFLVQFLRSDDDGYLLFGLAHSQYLALGMIAAAAFALAKLHCDPLPSQGPASNN